MPNTGNQLIESLPKGVQKRFLARCEPFELRQSAELSECGAVLTHAYLPNSGYIYLVIGADSRPPMEVGVVGREFMLGSELLLGVATTPWRSVVQMTGSCRRIGAESLRQALVDMPTLHALLQRNLMVRVHQQQSLASVMADQHHWGR